MICHDHKISITGREVPRRDQNRMSLQPQDANKIEVIGDRTRGDLKFYWEFMNYDEQKNDIERVLYVCVA